MAFETTDEWLSIRLKEPYLLASSISSSTDQSILEGTVTVTVSKATKVRWLRLQFAGLIRSAFYVDLSSISTAKTCAMRDKLSYGCQVLDIQEHIISSELKDPRILPAGTHTFPFLITIPGGLPPTLSSTAINVNYQVTASIQLASFIPFSQQYQVTKPFVLVHRDVAPEDMFFATGVLHLASKSSNRLTGRISSPSLVLPQSGIIPMMIHLNLQGKSTSVSKVTIELWESVFHQCPVDLNQDSAEGVKEIHLEERLVTRQNCPIIDWPTSTAEGEPAVIAKRLLFKVPEVPLKPWSEEVGEITIHDRRSSVPRGFCHSSRTFPHIRTRVEHTLRTVVYLEGLKEGEVEPDITEEDVAEQEIKVIVVGLHLQESGVDETLPPSYHRSFTNVLVEGARLAEIDRNSIEALRDPSLGEQLVFPPCYEESILSTPSSPRTRVAPEYDIRDSLDIRSLQDSYGESSSSSSTCGRPSTDTYAYDLAAYMERIQ
ncbi:hypothetical protein BGX26_012253 [Mortierella sp. AD094]|nr:hypothetical protein BGX26_012253 [Mortierella sp. AD094]